MISYGIRNGYRSTITNAQEGTIALVAGDKGATFYNTDLNTLRTWNGSIFENASGDGVPEAPLDSIPYVRYNAGWAAITTIIPTLQQVTEQGHYTDIGMIVGQGASQGIYHSSVASIYDSAAERGAGLVIDGLKFQDLGAITNVHPVAHGDGNIIDLYFPAVDGNLIVDSPENGIQYVRKDGAWVINTGGGAQGLQSVLDTGNSAISIDGDSGIQFDLSNASPSIYWQGVNDTTHTNFYVNQNNVELRMVGSAAPDTVEGNVRLTPDGTVRIAQTTKLGTIDAITTEILTQTPIADATLLFPSKAAGTYTLATTDEISAGQIIYDGIELLELTILDKDPTAFLGQTWWSRETKAAYKAITLESVTPTVVAWQKVTPQYSAITDTYDMPETQDGQKQNLGREIIDICVNDDIVPVTSTVPKVFLVGQPSLTFPEFSTATLIDAAGLFDGAKYGLNTTDGAVNGTFKLVAYGKSNGVDTSAWAVNNTLYVDIVSGELTNIKPSINAYIIGTVKVSDAVNGVIDVNTTAALDAAVQTAVFVGETYYWTGDTSAIDAARFDVNSGMKGTLDGTLVSGAVGNNATAVIAKELIFGPITADANVEQGTYDGNIEMLVNNTGANERVRVELYLGDAAGVVIDSGSGLPNGLAHPFAPITIFSSTVLSMSAGINQIRIGASVPNAVPTLTGQTFVYAVVVEKIGSSGPTKTFTINVGPSHFSFTQGLSVSSSALVPYQGATQDVNLGSHKIIAANVLTPIIQPPSGTSTLDFKDQYGSKMLFFDANGAGEFTNSVITQGIFIQAGNPSADNQVVNKGYGDTHYLGGGGIGEAPNDGQKYVRNGLTTSWEVETVTPPATGFVPYDGATDHLDMGSKHIQCSSLLTDSWSGATTGPSTIRNFANSVIMQLNEDRTILVHMDMTNNANSIAVDHVNTSDRRLKENIVDYKPRPINVRWREYEMKNNPSKQIGVIADELEEVAPEFVIKGKTSEDMDSVKYTRLLIAKVAELEERIKILEQN